MNNRDELNKIRKNVENNMYLGTPNEYRAFNFLLSELDRQHDEFYNEVRIAHQDKEMSSHNHALYAGELREKIISLSEEIESQRDEIEKMAERVYYAIQIWENMDMEDDPVQIMQKVINRLQSGTKDEGPLSTEYAQRSGGRMKN